MNARQIILRLFRPSTTPAAAGIALAALRVERRAEALLGDLQELRTQLAGIDRNGDAVHR